MLDTHTPRATIDFETRSPVNIKRCGAWIYSCHPDTEVMCLYIHLPHWPDDRVEGWHPAYPEHGVVEEGREALEELFAWVAAGGLVEAHNVSFELGVWENHCVPRLGWPAVPRRQWRCSAAKAAVHGLPRALGAACSALELPVQKDGVGRAMMLRLCKPRKPSKAEVGSPGFDPSVLLYHGSAEEFAVLWAYCGIDVLSEVGLSKALVDLSDEEQVVWFMDLEMNCRGMRADVAMARGALKIVTEYCAMLNAELHDITDGAVESGGQRAAFKDWIGTQGVDLPNTKGTTLVKFKKMSGLRPDLHRAIHIVGEVNKTSTAKYLTITKQADQTDERIRWQVMYCGASTGRWTGKGFQPHNIVKGHLEDADLACDVIRSGDLQYLISLYGSDSVMEVVSWACRGVLTASEGMELMVADFAAIEARVVLWLARQINALSIFDRGECIYCDLATGLYGYVVRKGIEKDERQFGKQGILGLGFQMGFLTFMLTCNKYGIRFSREMCLRIVGDEYGEHEAKVRGYFGGKLGPARNAKLRDGSATVEGLDCDWTEVIHELVLMKFTVEKYRARYPEVVAMWNDQEAAAIAAVQSPGRVVTCERGRNSYCVVGDFLEMRLPSGRPLRYPFPKVRLKKVPWSDTERRPQLTFMTALSSGAWVPQTTYGGMLVENLTQAVARDLMAQAMVRADRNPKYDVLMSVHDELIAECPTGVGDVREFERLMCVKPDWAHGCPIDAEGWKGQRYKK